MSRQKLNGIEAQVNVSIYNLRFGLLYGTMEVD